MVSWNSPNSSSVAYQWLSCVMDMLEINGCLVPINGWPRSLWATTCIWSTLLTFQRQSWRQGIHLEGTVTDPLAISIITVIRLWVLGGFRIPQKSCRDFITIHKKVCGTAGNVITFFSTPAPSLLRAYANFWVSQDVWFLRSHLWLRSPEWVEW